MANPKDRYKVFTSRARKIAEARDAMVHFIEQDDQVNANTAARDLIRRVDEGRKDVEFLVDEIHALQERIRLCMSAKS